MNRRALLLSALSLAAPSALRAEGGVRKAIAGDAFQDGADEIRLANILAPVADEPYAEEARAALNALLSGGPLRMDDIAPSDRWGRRVVTRAEANGSTLQELLVSSGAVRVRPETADYAFIRRLLTLENEARRARRGLWASRTYKPWLAKAATASVGGYHLVEGEVLKAAKFGSRLYLNFDENYREDFTVTAPARLARGWKSDGIVDLESLAGARIRARGYVASINGPSIEMTHPLQAEVLGTDSLEPQ